MTWFYLVLHRYMSRSFNSSCNWTVVRCVKNWQIWKSLKWWNYVDFTRKQNEIWKYLILQNKQKELWKYLTYALSNLIIGKPTLFHLIIQIYTYITSSIQQIFKTKRNTINKRLIRGGPWMSDRTHRWFYEISTITNAENVENNFKFKTCLVC